MSENLQDHKGHINEGPSAKCLKCNKKIGLLGFDCKCGSTFCELHRHPENHDCDFDFGSRDRENLRRANPFGTFENIIPVPNEKDKKDVPLQLEEENKQDNSSHLLGSEKLTNPIETRQMKVRPWRRLTREELRNQFPYRTIEEMRDYFPARAAANRNINKDLVDAKSYTLEEVRNMKVRTDLAVYQPPSAEEQKLIDKEAARRKMYDVEHPEEFSLDLDDIEGSKIV